MTEAEAAVDALGDCLRVLEASKAQRSQIPPWERPATQYPLPPQRKPSTPIARPPADLAVLQTVETPVAPSLPPIVTDPAVEPIHVATQPTPTPEYPLFVGPTPPRSTDDDATWLSHEGAALQRLPHPAANKQAPPAPAPRKLDVALWVSLAIALFLFWLVIGYLVPSLFGK